MEAQKTGTQPQPPDIEALEENLRKHRPRIELWKFYVGILAAVLIGICSGIITTFGFIRGWAQSAVQNEKFLGTLAAQVRPTCIFDSRGTLLNQFGTEDYISNILVTPIPKDYGFEIKVNGKKHLDNAPIVTGLNVGLYEAQAEPTPGTMNDWTILMIPQSTVSAILGEANMDTNGIYKFRLEILH